MKQKLINFLKKLCGLGKVQTPHKLYSKVTHETDKSFEESQPYVLFVENSTADVKTINLFGAIENIANLHPNGDYVGHGIAIKGASGVGVTYKDLLYESLLNPIKVSYTQIVCEKTQNNIKYKGLKEPIQCITRDAKGNKLSFFLLPQFKPNQVNEDIIICEIDFVINGFTKLIVNIPPYTSYRYFFYNINPLKTK